MAKSIWIAVGVHIIILSLVWVGFSIPLPRPAPDFFYSGASMPSQSISKDQDPAKSFFKNTPIKVDAPEAAFFVPWIQMRDLNKPKP